MMVGWSSYKPTRSVHPAQAIFFGLGYNPIHRWLDASEINWEYEKSNVDFDNEIYKLSIANTNSRGVKRSVYDKLKRRLKKYNLYRTYDYEKAIKSQVFLEPIVLPKNIREGLVEN